MVQVLLSWCWIGVSAFLWGFAVLRLIKKVDGYREKSLDMTLVLGLCFLTVYAQIFSLFYKVGAAATIFLLVIDLVIFLFWRKEIVSRFSVDRIRTICFVLIMGIVLMISATVIRHYDSYLYHAQSIRWIEEYGIVQGLGNLYNRLAYNSSFFPLQALFSMEFLLGNSLHSVNGFLVVLMVGYALCTMKVFKHKRIYASDFMRLALLMFLMDRENCCVISSPGSDILVLGLIVYILAKWVTYWEEGEQETAPYALLCLLGVYAVSVKLTAAMIVLLVLFPAIKLIVKKQWKHILFYVGLGAVIIAPFLIRNVVISGYLLYPYPELDLFQVDWKMPEYTLLFDRNEIKAWGWGLNDVYRYDAPIAEWFPVWVKTLGNTMEKMFYVNLLLVIPAMVYGIRRGIVKKDWNPCVIIISMIASLALWFGGSPLPRYGKIFLLLLPLFLLGEVLTYIFRNAKILYGIRITFAICIICCLKPAINYVRISEVNELKSPDYVAMEANEIMLGSEIIYCPAVGDQMGYHKFPSTPYAARLPLIELRGESLNNGFRMKEDYRDAFITTYGQVHETNMFE